MARLGFVDTEGNVFNLNSSSSKKKKKQVQAQAQVPAMAAVAQTVKPKSGIIDTAKDIYNAANILKGNAVTNLLGSFTQIPNSSLQEMELAAKKGKKINNVGDAAKQAINSLSTISNITNPLSMQNVINTANNMSKTTSKALKDKNKDAISKALSIGKSAVSNAADMVNPTHQLAESVFPFVGAIDKNADKKIRKIINAINDPINKKRAEYQNAAQQYGKIFSTVNEGVGSAANMASSLAATALTRNPSIAMAVMANNVKGQATEEAINQITENKRNEVVQKALSQGKTQQEALRLGNVAAEKTLNSTETLEEAREIGNVRAAAEVGTEMLSGGLANIYGKGATDDVAKNIIDRYIQNPTANFLATKASGIVGENVEESLSNILNKAIDKGTVDPNAKITMNDITEPWGPTTISTLLLNGATGDYSRASFNQNAAQLQAQSPITKVQNMNDVERNALTEITMKRKQGIPLDENDMATINYLNNRDNVVTDQNVPLNQNVQQTQENNFVYEPTDNVKINNFRQSASQFMNNSQQTQDFVNTVEKVINDKNYNITFDNTIGDDVNGRIRMNNGEVEIKINPNSERAGEFILTHEITHAIETKEMSNLIMDYASKDAKFNNLLQSVKESYGTKDITPEVVADISGQMFGDETFINNLSTTKPNVFKTIYDKIISLANKITGNSNEALFVRDLKNKWEKAYREANIETARENLGNETKLSKELDNSSFSMKENNDIRDRAKNEIGTTTNLNEAGYLTDDGEYLDFSGKRQGARGGQRQMDHREISDIYSDNEYDAAEKKYSNMGSATAILQDFISRGNIRLNGTGVEIATAPTQQQYDKLYDYLEHVQRDNGEVFIDLDTESNNRENLEYTDKTSISKMIKDIKNHYADIGRVENNQITQDNKGRTLTKDQQDFYKDVSKEVKDENGNLKTFYRGDPQEINVFDKNHKAKRYTNFGAEYESDIKGFFFTENPDFASDFGDVREYYLKATKPLNIEANKNDLNEIFKPMLDDMLENQDIYQWQYDKAVEDGTIYRRFIDEDGVDWETIDDDAFNKSINIMRKLGYDSMEVNEGEGGKSFFVFDSNQIKTVNNLHPTTNNDTRYSKENKQWREYLEKNFKNEGKKTYFKDTRMPLADVGKEKGTSDSSFSNDTINANKNIGNNLEILDKIPKENTKAFEKAKKHWNDMRHHITDHRAVFYDISREYKNPAINQKADAIDLANGLAQVDIGRNQVDIQGRAYNNFTDENGNKVPMSFEKAYDLYKDIPTKAKNEFLVHNLNIDRLNQGVEQFEGVEIPDSEDRLQELREQYPDIDKWAENIYQYNKNLLQKMVDSGRISQAAANEWSEKTPHYVRIQRDTSKLKKNGVTSKNGKISSENLIKTVKGSSLAILPIKETTAQYTVDTMEAIQYNQFGKELVKTLGVGSVENGSEQINDIDDIFGVDSTILAKDNQGNYSLRVYDKGIPVDLPINKEMYEALQPRDLRKIPITSSIGKFQREVLTNKNPFFGLARNPIKDAQDLFLYSKYSMPKSLKTYGELFIGRTVGKAKNKVFGTSDGVSTEDWVNLYYNRGNAANSYFANGEFESSKNKILRGIDTALSPLEKGNNFLESMPRITEFVNTIKDAGYTINKGEGEVLIPAKGKKPTKSVEQVLAEADFNSADVTVNFKRGGTWAKNIDRNGATFFSPSIQGAAKFGRMFSEAAGDAKRGDFAATKRLIGRAAILGVAPALLAKTMYGGDDDEYDDIQDYQKDQYYLIKRKDGTVLRIPKGRAISLFQSATRRGIEKVQGKEDAFNGYLQLVMNQIAPNNPLENNVFSPLWAVRDNKSWSGNKIIPSSYENKPAEEQYNEKTDELSKYISEKINSNETLKKKIPKNFRSAMGINYILDQYSGVIGDLTLPSITPKASSDTNNPIIASLKKDFTFEKEYSSKSVSSFYDTMEKLTEKGSSSKASAVDRAKMNYINSQSYALSDLYTKQHDIQNSKILSKKEKYDKAKEVQKEINKFTKDAVENVENIKQEQYYLKIGDDYYKRVIEDGKEKFKKDSSKGIPTNEYALYDYFKEKYEKSKR